MQTIAIIFFVGLLFVSFVAFGAHEQEENEKRLQREKEREIEREEKEKKKKQELESLLEKRAETFGNLTKHISIYSYNKEKDIYVYEESKTIFIYGKQYAFSDILSCKIETQCKRGQTTATTITTPDKGEMATQELLYGWGKKYNVKTHSETIQKTTPDTYTYRIYISIKSISEPQLTITLYSSDKANEINSLINVIVSYNNQV